MNTQSNQTYVLGDVEVKKTGRTATKTLPSGKVLIMEEITPVDEIVGRWKKWVDPTQLFIIA